MNFNNIIFNFKYIPQYFSEFLKHNQLFLCSSFKLFEFQIKSKLNLLSLISGFEVSIIILISIL